MAAAELTVARILEAVRQWPETKRKKLVEEIQALPKAKRALAAAKRLRASYQLGSKARKQLSQLLAKGNEGELSGLEKEELDRLVSEFEQSTLD